MSLKFNNTEVERLFFNGEEQNSLQFNGSGCFGKCFTLTQFSLFGVTVSIDRMSSPNQRAETGEIGTGNTIYYGDVIKIAVTAIANYTNPQLFVDVGDGAGLQSRTVPFTFTVTNAVRFSASATAPAVNWETVWTGTKTFTSSGEFSIPVLKSGGSVQVTATAKFKSYFKYEWEEKYEPISDFDDAINRRELPVTIYANIASLSLSRNEDKIIINFIADYDNSKGYYIVETPVSFTITEVRRRS